MVDVWTDGEQWFRIARCGHVVPYKNKDSAQRSHRKNTNCRDCAVVAEKRITIDDRWNLPEWKITELNDKYDAPNTYVVCSLPDCNRQSESKGMCSKHYYRQKKYGNPLAGAPLSEEVECSVGGCSRVAEKRTYCKKHYIAFNKKGDPLASKTYGDRKGWFQHNTGYIIVSGKGHPNSQINGSIMEHILIMAEHLGRPLYKDETVHHKNTLRWDNRIENLELWSGIQQPRGGRVEDLVAWAKYIIERYEGS